jgi:glutamate---cysteine ligase / carboxylate-amine ligase
MSTPHILPWFAAFGIELEWMVVDQSTLSVRPIVDQVLHGLAGQAAMEVELGPVAWSNELALHVIEMKTNGPSAQLEQAATELYQAVVNLGPALAAHGACLLPGGMHPFMDPATEFKLWPTDEEGIYGTFDRIFDCRGHGWSNLQSMHINLPFADDVQFARLHDAVRTLLPVLPALSASSPFKEGRRCANLDERLAVYRGNAAKVPAVSGYVVPERVNSRAEYEAKVLEPIYDALQAHDPEGALRYEWVNARGAIARFDRMAIEIRVLDTQESVKANLALAHGIVEVLRQAVLSERPAFAFAGSEPRLLGIFEQVVAAAEQAVITDRDYLAALGVNSAACNASEVWQQLLSTVPPERRSPALWPTLELIAREGCLARRILKATGNSPTPDTLRKVYERLARCLANNESFLP